MHRSANNAKRVWDEHLEENSMSYWQHLIFALGSGACIIVYGIRLMIHGLVPCYRVDAFRKAENYVANKRYKANWAAISNRSRLEKNEPRD